MKKEMTFENFPLWMVLTADAVSLGIYLAGAYIMFLFGAFWGWLYLFCCLARLK